MIKIHWCCLAFALSAAAVCADPPAKTIRLGIIGLDTSHVVAFTKHLNDPVNATGCKVVAAFPGGSPDLPISANRIEGFAKQLRERFNVEIVESIEALCQRVDGVLLESVDGRVHLEQIKPVLAAKKPTFIDKPLANNLADALEIFRLAEQAGVPCWSASDWRFSRSVQEVQNGRVGEVVGCMAYGPCALLPPFPDLYWYGIHTVEALFGVMGPGCASGARTTGAQSDVVVGRWHDGRIGVFRGGRGQHPGDGLVVFGSKGIHCGRLDDTDGYAELMKQIATFFKEGKTPVDPRSTLEVLAFMTAADASKAQGGRPVALADVMRKADVENRARQASILEASSAKKRLRVVFFGAHCDDNELGAGGLMRMLADQGHEVISAYATAFRRGRMVDGQPEETVRRAESTAACAILGAATHFFPYAHEDLEKPFADKKILEEILDWFDRVQPDVVVAHWPLDTHANHQVVGMSTWMAYDHLGRVWGDKQSTGEKRRRSWNLYYYEVNTFTKYDDLQSLGFQPNCYLDVTTVRDIKKKAVDCLKSQNPAEIWKVHDNMHVERGRQCGAPHAEAYFLVEAKPDCPLLPVPWINAK